MRILLLSLAYLLVAGFAARAQAPGVRLGEVQTFRNYEIVGESILRTDRGIFLYTYDAPRTTLGRGMMRNDFVPTDALHLYPYDRDLRATEPATPTWQGARGHYAMSASRNDLLWTYVTEGRKKDEYDFVTEVIDPASGKVTASHLVARVNPRDYNGLYYESARSANLDYTLQVFNEQSANRLLSKRDDEQATLSLSVIGPDGEVVTDLRKRVGIPRDQLEVTSATVGDDGRAYVLAKVYDNQGKREGRRNSRYDMTVYTAAPGADKIQTFRLQLGGEFIVGITAVPKEGGQPSILGLYSDRLDGLIRGVFATNDLSANTKLVPQPFSPEILEQLGRRVTTNRGGAPAGIERTFEFRAAAQSPDGTAALLLEDFYVSSSAPTPGNPNPSTRITFRENVLLEFDASGSLSGATMVPKSQTISVRGTGFGFVSRRQRQRIAREINNPYLGVGLVRLNGGFGMVYNDNAKNLFRPIDKNAKGTNFSKATAILAYTDEGGKLVRSPLFERREADKMLLHVDSGELFPDGTVAFVASRYRSFAKNEIRLGLIEPDSLLKGADGLRRR